LCNIPSKTKYPSHRNVTDSVISNPPISCPQHNEFEKREESAGDVDKWHEVMFDADDRHNFIKTDNIFVIKSIMEPKVKVNSPNLELVDLTSL